MTSTAHRSREAVDAIRAELEKVGAKEIKFGTSSSSRNHVNFKTQDGRALHMSWGLSPHRNIAQLVKADVRRLVRSGSITGIYHSRRQVKNMASLVKDDEIRIWTADPKPGFNTWIIVSKKAKAGDVVTYGLHKWKLSKREDFPGGLTFKEQK
jgi:hypothetical protein